MKSEDKFTTASQFYLSPEVEANDKENSASSHKDQDYLRSCMQDDFNHQLRI